jgi:hypothetical protein
MAIRCPRPCWGVLFGALVESCRVNKVNPLTYLTYVLSHVRDEQVKLLTPDEFTVSNITHIG